MKRPDRARIAGLTQAPFRAAARGGLVVALLGLFASGSRSQQCSWETYPDFQTNAVYAVYEYDGVVYRGGWFSLFQWDGVEWQTFGGGIGGDAGTLFAADIRAHGGKLVIGGRFPTAGGMIVNSIATWDGVTFGPVGGGVDGEVQSLVTYNGDLIAGGRFSTAGGVPATNIARWDGSAWHPFGAGVFDAVPDGTTDGVWDMVVWRGDLCVVGDFTHAGGIEVSYVARWDGSTWSDLGGGVSMIDGGPTGLRGVDVYDGDLVIVGALDFAGGVEAINVARWDGMVWSPVGSGPDPIGGPLNLRQAALSVASYGGLLYVGADFSEAVNSNAKALAVWDGDRWRAVDRGLDSSDGHFGPTVRDLEVCGESLLMGGTFDEANHQETDNMARYTCDGAVSVVSASHSGRPLQVELSQNPAMGRFDYTIQLGSQSNVSAALFDARGRRIQSLLDQSLSAGVHGFQVDSGRLGSRTDGVYFLRVEAEGTAVTRKLILFP